MRTSSQKAASRTNGRKSRGPRSEEGRQRSAANARRHGLCARPRGDDVQEWYRLILEDSNASTLEAAISPYHAATLALAIAEAWVADLELAEAEFLCPRDPAETEPFPSEHFRFSQPLWSDDLSIEPMDPDEVSLMQRLRGVAPEEKRAQFLPYRREAEAERARAFRVWIAALEAKAATAIEAGLASPAPTSRTAPESLQDVNSGPGAATSRRDGDPAATPTPAHRSPLNADHPLKGEP